MKKAVLWFASGVVTALLLGALVLWLAAPQIIHRLTNTSVSKPDNSAPIGSALAPVFAGSAAAKHQPQATRASNAGTHKALSSQEQTQLHNQIRAQLAALQGQKPDAALAQIHTIIGNIEKLARDQMDERSFDMLHQTLTLAAQAQSLSREFLHLTPSSNPADVARRKAILAQLPELSLRLNDQARAIQAWAQAQAPEQQGRKK